MGLLAALLLQTLQVLDRHRVEVTLFHLLFVVIGLFFARSFAGLTGSRGILETDRYHAHLALRVGYCRAQLEPPLRPDQVQVKGWSERIFAIGCAGDFTTDFAQYSVVESDTQRPLIAAQLFDLLAHFFKDHIGIDSGFGVKRVVGRPVLKLLSEDANQARDCVTARADQMS